MKVQEKHYTVMNGDVELAVSESGQGQTLLFLNGLGATRACWKGTIRDLNGQYRFVTFDFRNHGKSSSSHETSFANFQTDAQTIVDQVAGDRPILVGWSMGADLAVWYAASHPGKVSGLFLVDGAVPVNLVIDPDDIRRRLNTLAVKISPLFLYLAGMGYRLSPDDLARLTIDVNAPREQLFFAYEKIDCPVELVLAAKTAGATGERAGRTNALWRAGGELLASLHPTFSIQWLDNTHQLPFKEPAKLAEALDEFARRIQSDDLRGGQRVSQPGKEPVE